MVLSRCFKLILWGERLLPVQFYVLWQHQSNYKNTDASIIVQIIWVCPRYIDCVTITLNYIEINLYHQNQIVTLVSLSFWGSSNTPLYVYIGVQDSAQVEKLVLVSECSSCFKQNQNWTFKMPSFKHVFRVGITAASRTKHNPIYCMNSMLYHCSAWPPRSQLIELWSWKNKQTHNSQLMGFLTL